jgi:hypothetical protein
MARDLRLDLLRGPAVGRVVEQHPFVASDVVGCQLVSE